MDIQIMFLSLHVSLSAEEGFLALYSKKISSYFGQKRRENAI